MSHIVSTSTRLGRVLHLIIDEALLDLEHSLIKNILFERLALVHTLHQLGDEQTPAPPVVIFY